MEMPVKSIILAFAGTASAILLGYCVYFDHKRRMDPEYRRKVHNRREQAKIKEQLESDAVSNGCACPQGYSCRCDRIDNIFGMDMDVKMSAKPDPSDQDAFERYFFNEIKSGKHLISHGYLDEGLTHMANAIELCAQPDALLEMMQASLPDYIYRPLVQKLQILARHPSESSESSEILSNEEYDSQGTSDTSLPIPQLHTL